MKFLKSLSASLGAMALSMAAQAGNTAITPTLDGAWYSAYTDVAESGTAAWFDIDGQHSDTVSFDFTTATNAWLTVVDAGFTGDTFQVFDGSTLLGTTSAPGAANYPDLTFDFDAALANASFSRGVYLLSAGTHHITGWLAQSALDDTGAPINATFAGVRLEAAPLPEPSSWALAIAGLAFVVYVARRRAVL
jgi:hypothetical protein